MCPVRNVTYVSGRSAPFDSYMDDTLPRSHYLERAPRNCEPQKDARDVHKGLGFAEVDAADAEGHQF
jgi:hypothetical protein